MKEIKVETKYNEQMLREFFRSHFKLLNYMFAICGFLIMSSGVILLTFDPSRPTTGLVGLICGIFFMLYPIIIMCISMNQAKRSVNQVDEMEFREDSLHVVSTLLGEELVDTTIKYSALVKLVENFKYLYLYTSKQSALIIEKRTITKDERDFIVSHVDVNKNK